MTVAELIKNLSSLDQSKEICIIDADTGWRLPIDFASIDTDVPEEELPMGYDPAGHVILFGRY